MSLIWEDLIPQVAHDVRALVRKSLTNAQLLERALVPGAIPEIAPHIRAIIEAQMDLNRLFVRLVALAEAQTAVRHSSARRVEMVTLELAVMGAKMECRDAIHQANAELAILEPLPVCDVPQKTQVVLKELIENSVLFRDPTRPLRVEIRGYEHQGTVRVQVSDNGSGFDSVYAASLFQPFQRLDAQRSGFGLGLAISKSIVESVGGRIYIEPTEIGATFVFELANGVA